MIDNLVIENPELEKLRSPDFVFTKDSLPKIKEIWDKHKAVWDHLGKSWTPPEFKVNFNYTFTTPEIQEIGDIE